MKFLNLILAFSTLFGCAHMDKNPFKTSAKLLPKYQENWDYTDIYGNYNLKRQIKFDPNRLALKTELLSDKDEATEKNVTISQLEKKKIIPQQSEYATWFDGAHYDSKIQVDFANSTITNTLNTPDKKWKGTKKFSLNRDKAYCFFSQIAECIIIWNVFDRAMNQNDFEFPFTIIWDVYPFHTMQWNNVAEAIQSSATLSLEAIEEKFIQLKVETGEHIFFYNFDEKLSYSGFYWVAQGIRQQNKRTRK